MVVSGHVSGYLSGVAGLGRNELAVLDRELLLCGHLIDRAGMPYTLAALGRAGMVAVAVAEWQAASPVYTRRMRAALDYGGDDVETIFKGLQLDIGAPPQFMDFRFRVDDPGRGEFRLDHCGALMDVEPMGAEFVVAMCHDIEDPTFDATAAATNPRARVRPVYRPPRTPADRTPHCAWTVVIDPAATPIPEHPDTGRLSKSAAAQLDPTPLDPADPGRSDYRGPLLSDLRFEDFSRSALVRIADEVALQHHLLALGFRHAVTERLGAAGALDVVRNQFTGIAGLTARRIRAAFDLGDDAAGLCAVLALHPVFNPARYVGARFDRKGDAVRIELPRRGTGAAADEAWPTLLAPERLAPLDALARGVNPRFRCHTAAADADTLTVDIALDPEPHEQAVEVAITALSTGANFAFADRGTPLPLTVVRRPHGGFHPPA
ncbi:MAG: hypothetical protein HOQ24_16585 [Mycobacteriaceae bacterium]|nr:hypothetical protein [Mycobacteriaceae bacterium]